MLAKSQKPLSVGTQVLVVTCPVLAHYVIQIWFRREGMGKIFQQQYELLLDGLQLNQTHGVFTGEVTVEGQETRDRFGLVELQINVDDKPKMRTDEALAEAMQPLRKFEEDQPYLGVNQLPRSRSDLFGGVLEMMYEDLTGPAPTPIERPWQTHIRFPDEVEESIGEAENPALFVARVQGMTPEEQQALEDSVRQSNDRELIAVMDLTDPKETLKRYIQIMVQRRKALNPTEPIALIVPLQDGHRDFIASCAERMLDNAVNQAHAALNHRKGFL